MANISHDEAVAIKSRFEGSVIHLPGVTGIDVGLRGGSTDELAIRVYVESLARAPKLPAAVEGLPVEVIERRFGLQR